MTLRDVHARRIAVDSLGRKRVCLSLAERLWRHVDKSGGSDACWPYTGAKSSAGYGSLGGRTGGGAHRVAYEAANGPIPGTIQVCHRCDNPPCCNPAHLFLGTVLDNSLDMVNKGRAADTRNERSAMARLTDAQVAEIRDRATTGETLKDLAREFGVSGPHLSRVMQGTRRPREGVPQATSGRRQSISGRERTAKMVSLYEGGLSTTEVGRRLGLHPSRVSRVLRAAGVEMRPQTREFYLPPVSLDAVRQMHGDGVRAKEIARRLGVGPRRITRILDELGLPRFGPGNPHLVTVKIHQKAGAQ